MMNGQTNPENIFDLGEAVAAVRLVALALQCSEVMEEQEVKLAGRLLQEAHFTLDIHLSDVHTVES